ncbi:MAG: efflux transporter outer membrane subunit [Candidatus Sulfobium sp.]|jgi:NodT family efflux transporter outer membrane factor (OMF) lipoprotein
MPKVKFALSHLGKLMFILPSWIAAAVVLAGCSAGPDFHRPEAPATERYTRAALPEKTVSAPGTAGAAQYLFSGRDIPPQWWELFRSGALDGLIRKALKDSPTLSAAEAALRNAQENLTAQTGVVLYPAIDAKGTVYRQRFSGASFGEPGIGVLFTLYNASVDVSYTLDLFGGGRRELEALRSQVDYQRFQLEGAHLTLTSNIVTAAVREASLRAQIESTREVVADQEKQLEVVRRQFDLGGVSRSDVLAQSAQVAQTRATLPPLEKALAQTRHLLAALSGGMPGDAVLPEFTLGEFRLPQELPVSLPSLLVRQRPDIRASEELLHAASAQIGVATANLYPQVTLTGEYGSEATKFHNLFGSGTSIWNISAGLLQPLFHGGELTAKRRAAIAAYDQAAAQYRETVLQAFRNVADVLRALEDDARTLKAQSQAEAAARATLDLVERQFNLGAVSYLSLLNAQRQYRLARVVLVRAQAARLADTAALFQALGGGWWNRQAGDDARAAAMTEEKE